MLTRNDLREFVLGHLWAILAVIALCSVVGGCSVDSNDCRRMCAPRAVQSFVQAFGQCECSCQKVDATTDGGAK